MSSSTPGPELDPSPFAPPTSELQAHGPHSSYCFEVTYRLTKLDYLLWNLAHQAQSPAIQVTSAGLAGTIAYLGTERPWIGMFLGYYVLFWIAQFAFTCFVVLLGRNRLLLTEYRTAIASKGLVVQSKFGHSTHYWSGIQRVVAMPSIVAVYTSAHGAQLIPKRAFSGQPELAQFLAVLKARRDA